MKKIVLVLLVAIFITPTLLAQETLRDAVKEYQDHNSEFTIVIPSFLIKMGVAFGDMEEDEKEVLSQIRNMKIVISDSHFHKNDFSLLEEGIKSGNFQEVMTVHDGRDKIRMIMNKKTKRKTEMLMLVEGYNDNVIMLFDFHGEPDFKKLLSLAD